MIASLPMYDLPCLQRWTDAWWQGLARALRRQGIREVPRRLDRSKPYRAAWTADDLLLSQCCGYPLVFGLAQTLSVIATPSYAAAGCSGPRYRSYILVADASRASGLADLHGSICAANATDSQSGSNAFAAALAAAQLTAPFFSGALWTGSHVESMAAVREGAAQACAVDCVTYALLGRHQPESIEGLRILAETPDAPALPYVTRANVGDDMLARLRAGLFAALSDPDLAEVRDALLLREVRILPADAYQEIAEMAAAGGGPKALAGSIPPT